MRTWNSSHPVYSRTDFSPRQTHGSNRARACVLDKATSHTQFPQSTAATAPSPSPQLFSSLQPKLTPAGQASNALPIPYAGNITSLHKHQLIHALEVIRMR